MLITPGFTEQCCTPRIEAELSYGGQEKEINGEIEKEINYTSFRVYAAGVS